MADPATDDGPTDDGEDLVDKARLVSFTDNVISIAITLLVLDVRLPPGLGHLTVGGVLRRTGPNLLGFVLSFVIVGVYWVGHHLMLRNLRVVPRSALWANNLFLLCITLLPASAALLGGYPGQRASAVLYGANLVMVGASLSLLLNTAVRCHHRLGLALSPRSVRLGYSRTGVSVATAGIGIGLAWVSPWASYAVYCLTPAVYVLVQLLPTGGPGGPRRGPLKSGRWRADNGSVNRTPARAFRAASRLLADDGGGEVIEYALILGLIGVVALAVIAGFGTKVLARWTSVNGSM